MEDKPQPSRPTAAAVLDRLVENYPGPALIVGQGIRVVESNEAARGLALALRSGHPALIDLIEDARHAPQGLVRELTLERGRVVEATAMSIGAAVLVLGRDVTVERQRLAILVEQRQRLADIVGCIGDFSFETDRDGRLTFAAPDNVLGYRAESLIGQHAADLIDPDWLAGRSNPFLVDHPVSDSEVWLCAQDGTRVCVRLSCLPVLDEFGQPVAVRGVARDVTAGRAREMALSQALDRERLRGAVVDAMRGPGGPERAIRVAAEAAMAALNAQGALVIARTDRDSAAVIVSLGIAERALADRLARDIAGLIATPSALGRVETATIGPHAALIAVAGEGGSPIGALVLLRPARLGWQPEQATLLGAVADQLGLALGLRERVAQLEALGRVDALTGIMNRRAFDIELPIKLRQADRLERPGALLLLDLDDFKPLNDHFGHGVGDKALSAIGDLLRNHLRAGDLAARIGGDEFALWLDGADAAGAFAKTGALYDLMDGVDRHLALPGRQLGLSIGIAVYQPGRQESREDLIARADKALYRAKHRGRNRAELAPDSGSAPC